jgi:hypothetical protein
VLRDVIKHEGKTELMDSGSFERSAAKLVTEAMTELGAKDEAFGVAQAEQTRSLIPVVVSGFKDFAQYSAARAQLDAKLKGVGSLEEQRISQGRAVFGVLTEKSYGDVRGILAGFEMPGIQVEIQ